VVLHAGIVYEPILENSWIVSDPDKANSIGLIRMYINIFVMFMLFFISGYFIPNSLRNKSDRSFVISKFKRILTPWMVAVFTMIPAYKAIFLYSRGLPQDKWYTYFHFFQRVGGDMSSFADNPVQNWLWFLPVLFVFQLMYLGLFKTKLLSFRISIKNAVIIILIIGVANSMLISFLDLRGWYHSAFLHFQNERLLTYFLVFLLGSLCHKRKVFDSSKKNIKLYIWANISLTLSLGLYTVVALNLFFNIVEPARNYFFVSETIDKIAYYTSLLISMFSFLYVFIHAFRFSFNKTNSFIQELNMNSYAVYIIHVPVIGFIALFFLNAAIPAMMKFLSVTILAFIISNLLVILYRKTLQQFFSKNIFRIGVPVAFCLLTIIVYVNQIQALAKLDTEVVSKAKVLGPKIDLHTAVIEGDFDAVKKHIQAGSDLEVKEPSGGSSPLILAVLLGKTEIAIALIEAGTDVNLKNKEGSTALHTAAFFCRPEIVRVLLASGADKTIVNNSGSTAFEIVVAPYEDVVGIYDYFGKTLGPIGLELDYSFIKKTRPVIAEMLQQQ
jgi:hypothetical protein